MDDFTLSAGTVRESPEFCAGWVYAKDITIRLIYSIETQQVVSKLYSITKGARYAQFWQSMAAINNFGVLNVPTVRLVKTGVDMYGEVFYPSGGIYNNFGKYVNIAEELPSVRGGGKLSVPSGEFSLGGLYIIDQTTYNKYTEQDLADIRAINFNHGSQVLPEDDWYGRFPRTYAGGLKAQERIHAKQGFF